MDIRSKHTTKTALRALMRSDKLSKVLKDGINAPIGSTKRKHAQEILRVVQRTTPNIDGAGGAENSLFSRRQNQPMTRRVLPQTRPNYSRLNVFQATPPIRRAIGSKISENRQTGLIDAAIEQGIPMQRPVVRPRGVVDGAGGIYDDFAVEPIKEQPQPVSSWGRLVNYMKGIFGSDAPTNAQPRPQNDALSVTGSGSYNPYAIPPKVTSSNLTYKGEGVQTQPKVTSQPITPRQDFLVSQDTTYGDIPTSYGPSKFPSLSGTGDKSLSVSDAPEGYVVPQVSGIGDYTGQSGSSGDTSIDSGTGTGDTLVTNPLLAKNPVIAAALESGRYTPRSFASEKMNDLEYLRGIAAFDQYSDEQLTGGSLQSRVNQLQRSIRMDYDLEQKEGMLINLINQGVGLEGRLEDYVRGRDVFLNETDSMLESFKDRMLNMDLADPQIRNSAEMYSNYLFSLKGRANKRYIQFLNGSIDQYNAKLTASQNVLDTTVARAQRELEMDSVLTEETYNNIFTTLGEMYIQVQNEPNRLREEELMKLQIQAARVAIVQDAASQYGVNEALTDSGPEAWAKLKKGGFVNTVGGVDYVNVQELTADNFINMQADGTVNYLNLIQAVLRSTNREITNNGVDPDNPLGAEGIMEVGGHAITLFDSLVAAGIIPTVEKAEQYKGNIRGMMSASLDNNKVFPIKESAEGIRTAVTWLSQGDNSKFIGLGDAATRDELHARAAKKGWKLAPQLLDLLYNQFEGYIDDRAEFAGFKLYTTHPETGERVMKSDASLVRGMIDSYTESLGNIAPWNPGEQSIGPVGTAETKPTSPGYANTRNVRNNNPFNIKSNSVTREWDGYAGTDTKGFGPGGIHGEGFLIFNTWKAGYDAAKNLIEGPTYTFKTINGKLDRTKLMSVDDALHRWSDENPDLRDGYGVDSNAADFGQFVNRTMQSLSLEEVKKLLDEMFKIELGNPETLA